MADPLTLMAVHAHPDDEAIGTGGTLARYAREGVRVVLVTCTGGELGDMPGGTKPEHDAHDAGAVVAIRRAELEESCRVLGVAHLELLGYHDSGMMGWPQNTAPHAFWNTPVEEAAARVAALMERYRPQVVLTYDANGFYGHPDHIQAHRVTHAAAERTGIPRKLYHTAVGRDRIRRLYETFVERGLVPADAGLDFDPADPPFGIPDEEITSTIDVSGFLAAKRDSIAAHASQGENLFPLKMPEEAFGEVFGRESYVRVLDTTGAPLPEDDLFAGLR